MNKKNPFPTLIAVFPLIFLSNLSKIDEVALAANLGKSSLTKGTKSLIMLFGLRYLIF